jgi:hypothetical protein
MKTEKDAILRMACGFMQPVPHGRGHHWYQIMGTQGCVEWSRSSREMMLWLSQAAAWLECSLTLRRRRRMNDRAQVLSLSAV